MDVTWLDRLDLDDRDVAGITALLEAVRLVDSPAQLPDTLRAVTARLQHGWDGEPPIPAVVRDERGRATGFVAVFLPRWDNTHLGYLELFVDPAVRRRGIGRLLFENAVERIRAEGRRLVVIDGFDLPASVGFAKAMGLDRASEEMQRRQDLRDLDQDALDRELEAARDHSAGYEMLRITGPIPENLMPDVAAMAGAINDAPTDNLDIEDEVFSPERIRTYVSAQLAYGRRLYRLVARERATGALAGQTVVAVEGEHPWHAWQHDTSVVRQHRGNRLGLVLKIAMLQWLAEAEPQLRTLDTWNAASNAHMISVNEVLGYQVLANAIAWQRHL